jgi:hypothetical protein
MVGWMELWEEREEASRRKQEREWVIRGERQRTAVKSSGAASDVSDAPPCFGGMRCVRSASDSGRFSSSAETSKGQRQMARARADAGAAAFACIHVFLSMLIDCLYGMAEFPHQHPCSSVTAAAKCETGLVRYWAN